MTGEHDDAYVRCCHEIRDELVPNHGWTDEPGEFWYYCRPPGHAPRPQGWKLHLSATLGSAEQVLAAASRVLFARGAAFKFAKGADQLTQMLSIRMERGMSGKFITVYPDNDDHFRELAEALADATEGMVGPAILSDRPYRKGGIVFYRYGGFSGDQRVLGMDGAYNPVLIAPDGQYQVDARNAWYSPPVWARSPIPEPPRRDDAERGKATVLLDERFEVKEAIRHSNRGGVYRATDHHTGATVIIKQARPHVAGERDGKDARDYLRNEATHLRTLAPLGLSPSVVSVFEYQGDLFLAEDEVDGVTLRNWVMQKLTDSADRTVPAEPVLALLRRLVAIVAQVHELGLVFRDLTPGNVMVTADGRLILIDPEFMAVPGEPVVRAMTLSYVAPEEATGPHICPAPPQVSDLYSLGACLIFLCTGVDPFLPDDKGTEIRSRTARIRDLVDALASKHSLLGRLAEPAIGLLDADPAKRWPLTRVREWLDAADVDDLPAPQPRALAVPEQQRLLVDGRAELVAAASDGPRATWRPIDYNGRIGDSCSVQAGNAGPLAVLTAAWQAAPEDDGLRDLVGRAAHGLAHGVQDGARLLPGLYFGRAGAAWALHDAGAALGDEHIVATALALAKRLPVAWGNPDLTHGVAGSGMAQLHLWRRTGDEELRARVLLCVESILAARDTSDGAISWPVSGAIDSRLAGVKHFGFAHGIAGICTFLISAARELDRPDLLDIARAGAEVLIAEGKPVGDGTMWSSGDEETGGDRLVCWWCNGAGGIGIFFARLWHATGEERFREMAHRCAVAARHEPWLLPAGHCHGIAGNGELLLDLAAVTGDPLYRQWAAEHAAVLQQRCMLKDGRLVTTGESGMDVTYSYNLGLAGVVGFLHRLRVGGERWWHVDDFALPPADGAAEVAR